MQSGMRVIRRGMCMHIVNSRTANSLDALLAKQKRNNIKLISKIKEWIKEWTGDTAFDDRMQYDKMKQSHIDRCSELNYKTW